MNDKQLATDFNCEHLKMFCWFDNLTDLYKKQNYFFIIDFYIDVNNTRLNGLMMFTSIVFF